MTHKLITNCLLSRKVMSTEKSISSISIRKEVFDIWACKSLGQHLIANDADSVFVSVTQ